MKTRIRDSYTPKLGDYCNTLVIDKETGNQYLFDADGVWTLISTDEEGIVAEAVAQANAYTDDVAEGKVDKEEGKGLSENDFTDEDKEKLDDIEEGAQENIIEVVKRNGVALPVTDKTVDIAVPTTTSSLTNDSGYITNAVDDLVNYYDKDETDTLIATEAETRDAADLNLQEQIDAISSASDVVDVVGTYAELQNYDTSKLGDNDIIKVLTDETHDDAISYYRWNDTTETFSYIGSQGPFYTKSETDATFVPQTRTINGKGLNSDVVLTAADVNALPASTVIPTVNDATLTIKKNGTTVTTFTANSAQNATADISVPTKVSDLTNDLDFVEEADLADVAFSGDYADLTGTPSIPTKTSDLTNDSDFVSDANYVHTDNNFTTALKNKLNGIAAGAEVNVQSDWNVTDTTSDAFIKNKPSIPTKTSDLTNDSGFITSAALPTKTSDLTNDSGFITKNVSDLTNYYTQSEVNGMFNALSIPTKTSDLVNDSGFLTSIPIASASTLGGVKIGSGINVAADGTISAAVASLDWDNITNKPTNVSYWTNDAGYITSAALPTKTSDLTNDSGFITSADVPTKTSDLTNDSGFITSSVNNLTNYYTKSQTYTQGEVNSLLSAIVIPTKTSDLTNDGSDGTAQYLETDETAYATASIPYAKVDSTSTSTAFTATVPGITQLRQGVSFWLENGVVTSASGFTININNLGAKPVYSNLAAATRDTTIFNSGYTMLFVYDADRVEGGAFVCYRGYDANTNTIGYQLRTNSSTLPAKETGYRYRLWLTSADGQGYVPINTATGTSTTSNKALNTDTPIDPFGAIVYNSTNGTVNANANLPTGTQWSQYILDIRYQKYPLTLTYPDPVYLQCTPQSTGGALINDIVQTLPATEDGKIYIYLGTAYSATSMELKPNHPVYYYKDGAIRAYTNAAAGISSVAWGDITGTLSDQTDLNTALGAKANSADLATVATSGSYTDLTDKPTIPTVNNATLTIQKNNTNVATFTANAASNVTANISVPTATSDLTNDSGFLTSSTLPVATSSSLGVIQVGSGLTVSSGGVLSATGGGVADSVAWGHITGTLADQTDLQDELDAKANTADLATVATSGSYNDLADKPTIPTVNNATLTIQKNSTSVGTFTANASQNKTINITVPTTAADVSALPDSTKYATSLTASINTTTYVMTLTLKDQDGNTLGTAQTIDLPLESVVVNGSYDSTNKKIVLTLQSGSTIDIPVGDLISGLQTEITSTNKLDSDLVDDTGQTHKFMTSAEKTKLSGIAAGAEVNVQSDWTQTTTTADDYIKNKPSLATVATSGSYNDLSDKPTIPTVNNATLTIQKNGTTVKTFTANASSNVTANITVPTKTSDLTNDSGFLTSVAWTDVTGKPTFATVATSGSYNDLSDKPTIPTVNNATLTIQKNGTTVKTFTANASSNVTANITVPTTVAELSDASTYVTQNSLATQLANKQDTLTAGDHINITGSTIKAVDYVHSDDPVSTTAVTPVVTNNMIADGTITADKLATGATVKLTLSTSDIGEGAALAANTLYGVYI